MIKKKCRVCRKGIFIKRFHANKGWGKYCSKRCQGRAQYNGRWVKCNYCDKKIYRTPKDFKRSRSGKFFCSVACHCSWENKHKRSGINAPNWIDGQTVYKRILIRSGRVKKCSSCGTCDSRVLVVHHRDRNRHNSKIENLEWLCMNCHYLEHLKDKVMEAMV